MKLAEVIQDGRFGGIAARSLLTSVALRKRGVESVFILPTDGGDVSSRAQRLGFNVVRVMLRRPHPRRPVQTLWWFVTFPLSVWSLGRAFHREEIDVVHANGMICLQAVVAGRLARIPVIWHLAGTNMYPRLFSRTVLRTLGRNVRKVFIADRVRKYFQGNVPLSSRDRIIHEPVDLERISGAQLAHVPGCFRQEMGIPEDGILICTVANITSLKGIDVLLSAAKEVVRRHPEVHFVVVGRKLETQRNFTIKLESQIRACNMESHFLLCGYRDDVPSLLQDCDIFVFPSLSEGTPISILEAMASGVPVVATDVGGIPEQIQAGKSGLLVSPSDADGLAEAIVELVESPELRAHLSQNALTHVQGGFSLDVFCDQFYTLLGECADGNGRSDRDVEAASHGP